MDSPGGLSESEELELLQLQKAKAMAGQQQTPPPPSFEQQLPDIAKQAASAGISGPISAAQATDQFFKTDPATMQRQGGLALPIVGGALAGPIGAMLGEGARQVTGTAFAPETVPQTALGRGASMLGAGIAQEPSAFPGVGKVGEMASDLASKAGKGLAKAAQAFSGGKAGDYIEAANKGWSTYSAPSKSEAGQMMAKAIEKLPGQSISPTLQETVQGAISPESSAANKFLVDLAGKIDQGHLPDAREALRAKQALDDVIDTVPKSQVKRLGNLYNLKNTFDDVLSNQSGELKNASNAYRAAVLKSNMTKFLPVNKSGEYSRLAPMLSSIAGTAKGLVTSPLLFGGLATTAGEGAKGLNVIGQNPVARQALLQVLQRIQGNSNAVAGQ